MKVLIFGSQARYQAYQPDFVAQLPVEPVFCPIDQPLHEAAARHSDAQALFVDAITPVDRAMMELLPQLKLIHSEGVAFNRIDLEAARERGAFLYAGETIYPNCPLPGLRLTDLRRAMALLAGKEGFLCQYDKRGGRGTVWAAIYDVKCHAVWRAEGNPARRHFAQDGRFKF